jgi:hypothetical protein
VVTEVGTVFPLILPFLALLLQVAVQMSTKQLVASRVGAVPLPAVHFGWSLEDGVYGEYSLKTCIQFGSFSYYYFFIFCATYADPPCACLLTGKVSQDTETQ